MKSRSTFIVTLSSAKLLCICGVQNPTERPAFDDIKTKLAEIASKTFNSTPERALHTKRAKQQALLNQMLPSKVQCHALLCHAMLCHAVPCYAMLCYCTRSVVQHETQTSKQTKHQSLVSFDTAVALQLVHETHRLACCGRSHPNAHGSPQLLAAHARCCFLSVHVLEVYRSPDLVQGF